MKIRHPLLLRWLAFLGSLVLRLYLSLLRYRYYHLGPVCDPHRRMPPGQSLFPFWHEYLLFPAYQYGTPAIKCLVSQHADGEIIAQVLQHMGFGTIRGSSTRGGAQALRQMIAQSARANIVLIPDGPRGPRRRVEPGVIYLASRTGLPIIALGVGYQKAWRLRTWDRFAIPKPFSRVVMVTGRPILVPPKVRKEELERYRLIVEAAINEATALAERLAGGMVETAAAAPQRQAA